MSRTLKNRKLDSRTSRRAVPQGKSTQWIPISRGRALGYRRGRKGGTWVARFDAADLRREQKLGEADDVLDADGVQILDFAQALQKASKFFLSALAQATGEMTHTGPYTVELVARDYLKSLENRGAPDHRGAVYDFNRNIIPQIGAWTSPSSRGQSLKRGGRNSPNDRDFHGRNRRLMQRDKNRKLQRKMKSGNGEQRPIGQSADW